MSWVATGAFVLLVATAGCSGSEPETAGSNAGEEDAPVVLTLSEDASGSGDARIAGKLILVEGCVSIEGPESTYLAVWPRGTTWASGTLVVAGGTELELGSEVDLGGSYTREPPEGVTPEVPAGCRDAASEFVVISRP